MRSALPLIFCLGFWACADPEEMDAGNPPADSGTVVDTGVPRDTGVAIDTGATIDTGIQTDTGVEVDTGVDGGVADAASDASPGDSGDDPDAAPSDVDPGMDVAPSDAGQTFGPVTVVFLANGGPSPIGGTAMFHDSTGVLIASHTTTAAVIVQDVPSGAMLTVYAPIQTGKGPPSLDLNTIVGIEPGETYNVDPYRGIPILGDMAITAGTAYPGAAYYELDYGCEPFFLSDPTQSLLLGIETGCSGSSTTSFDLLVTAYDGQDLPIAYRVAEQVPIVPNGSATMTGPWLTTFQDLDVTVLNPLIGATGLQATLGLTSRGAAYDRYRGTATIDLTVSAGGTVPFRRPIFGDGMIYHLDQFGQPGEVSWVAAHAITQGQITADLTADFLPYPSAVTITTLPTAPDRPTATWSATMGTDVVVIRIAVDDPPLQWLFVMPSTATALQLPELPDDYAFARPLATSSVFAARAVIESTALPDYATVRALVGSSMLQWVESLDAGRLPPGVTVRGAVSAP